MSTSDPFVMLGKRNRPIKVASLGECMIELSDLDADDGCVAMGVAGDTLNFAIYLARCCSGLPFEVSYLTALGQDTFSDRMVDVMQAERIATDQIVRFADKLPGLYAIELDQRGERSFRYWRSQSAAKSMLDAGGLSDAAIESFDVLVLSGISLAILPPPARQRLIAICHRMKAAGKVIVFDSNYRPALWDCAAEARETFEAMWKATTLGLPSRDDEARLWPAESPHQIFARLDVAEIALKDGAGGPWLYAGESPTKANYPAVAKVVDTTSAGDAFNAGYLAARLKGGSPSEAARAGHDLASVVIGYPGAIIPQVAMPVLG